MVLNYVERIFPDEGEKFCRGGFDNPAPSLVTDLGCIVTGTMHCISCSLVLDRLWYPLRFVLFYFSFVLFTAIKRKYCIDAVRPVVINLAFA